jgi:ABC-2 type transport system permease protein
MLSVATVWAASTVIFNAGWGDPAAVAVLVTVTATATVALSFGLATLTRSEASFDGVVAVVAFILVLAGGNFVPPAALPGGLRRLTLVTPNGWALRGFLDLATSSAGVSAIIVPLLAIMTFTVTIWVAVSFRLGRLISP